jgi:peptide/nickel transport system substrate-binding protein
MRPTWRRTAAISGLGLSAMVMATACSSGPTAKPSSAAPTNTVVKMTLPGPDTDFDPATNTASQAHTLDLALYDTLVVLNSQNQAIPDLAASWVVTPNSADFTLKSGPTCSDGTKVTPEVVAGSLNRFFAPATDANVTQIIGPGNSATVSTDDAKNSVKITLANPYSGLLPGMANFITGIVCPAGVSNPQIMTTKSEGTGPYVLQSEVSGSSYTLQARKDYTWGPKFPGQPHGTLPSQLVATVVTDENAAANLMLTGAADVSGFQTSNVTRVDGQKGFTATVQPLFLTYLIYNEAPGHPTASQAVRQAIAQAIDRTAQNSAQTNGKGTVMTSLATPASTCTGPDPQKLIPATNTSAASNVLKGLSIKIIGSEILNNGQGQTYLQAALDNAGAKASLTNLDNQSWVADLNAGKNDWDLTIQIETNGVGSFFTATPTFLGPFPPAGHNSGNVNNAAALAQYRKASQTLGTTQCQAWLQMQADVLSRNDILPLSTAPNTLVFDSHVTGLGVGGYFQPGTFRVK